MQERLRKLHQAQQEEELRKRRAEQEEKERVQAAEEASRSRVTNHPNHQELLKLAQSPEITEIMRAVWEKWSGGKTIQAQAGLLGRKKVTKTVPVPFEIRVNSDLRRQIEVACDLFEYKGRMISFRIFFQFPVGFEDVEEAIQFILPYSVYESSHWDDPGGYTECYHRYDNIDDLAEGVALMIFKNLEFFQSRSGYRDYY